MDAAFPGAVSESALLGGTPAADEGEAFLDCLLEVGASEPSLEDVAAVGSEGLSVPTGCGWDLGAMVTAMARAPLSTSWVRQRERFGGNEAPTFLFPAGAARSDQGPVTQTARVQKTGGVTCGGSSPYGQEEHQKLGPA